MIDLRMVVRKDGLTVKEAMADEPFGFALSFTPDENPDDVRTLVVRWPAFITFSLVVTILSFIERHIMEWLS